MFCPVFNNVETRWKEKIDEHSVNFSFLDLHQRTLDRTMSLHKFHIGCPWKYVIGSLNSRARAFSADHLVLKIWQTITSSQIFSPTGLVHQVINYIVWRRTYIIISLRNINEGSYSPSTRLTTWYLQFV